MPDERSFSKKRGRTPVALNRSEHFAVFGDAAFLEKENILHGDLLAFEADEFGDVSDFATAIAEAGDLHHQVDRAGDLVADGADAMFAFAMPTRTSRRPTASRGVLEWMVVREPS